MADLDQAYRSGKTPKQAAKNNQRTEEADKKLAAKIAPKKSN